jgi:hypothetical protein
MKFTGSRNSAALVGWVMIVPFGNIFFTWSANSTALIFFTFGFRGRGL